MVFIAACTYWDTRLLDLLFIIKSVAPCCRCNFGVISSSLQPTDFLTTRFWVVTWPAATRFSLLNDKGGKGERAWDGGCWDGAEREKRFHWYEVVLESGRLGMWLTCYQQPTSNNNNLNLCHASVTLFNLTWALSATTQQLFIVLINLSIL